MRNLISDQKFNQGNVHWNTKVNIFLLCNSQIHIYIVFAPEGTHTHMHTHVAHTWGISCDDEEISSFITGTIFPEDKALNLAILLLHLAKNVLTISMKNWSFDQFAKYDPVFLKTVHMNALE